MPFVITQRCCNDASCVTECPVDCIRPRPDDPEYGTTEMLYIDPDTCIDCGACVDACPVGAIYSDYDLPVSLTRFAELNQAYFQRHPLESTDLAPPRAPERLPDELGTLRVAIVGSGPAGCYAAVELLQYGNVEVEMFDRLPAPWGLVRSGVAPDHPETKAVAEMFSSAFRGDAFEFRLDVEVGEHISLAELRRHHHAVVYAVGAPGDRRLGIPGEDLPGSHSATEFVAWYNGHPDYTDREFDLSGERAVIVGNGNVALDVARILTLDPDVLAKTDIAYHALEALRSSNIREVVVLGRRGPVQAAYSAPEFLALGYLPSVDVVVDEAELTLDPASRAVLDDPDVEPSLTLKLDLAHEYAGKPARDGNKRIVFRYLVSPTELRGSGRVDSVELVHNTLDADLNAVPANETEGVKASLVLRAVGYRGEPVADLPFDDARRVIPNSRGRVEGMPGVYTTGWIKRGPRGVIGTNRADSQETVATLLEDFRAGMLAEPEFDRSALNALLAERRPQSVDKARWRAIDAAEKAAGTAVGRPRVKNVALDVTVPAIGE
ncbi:FAD-dependent oxidoreductase [Rhodococcus sp. DMU1]|uniref:FAD-dependent oxidoreductase n=1 Tax=Rhodococcus sp. DMU1 TaxID=2722825 RepID=UPI00143EB739|nr:FAD-dependent oxidoreductase [Rhodococcus sp. DMU1]QIX52632.1 FAD-dependent oxidoreductase [Rhodococcus sp. DMU1]